MGVNLHVAIYTGLAGAIFLSVFPAIFGRKSLKRERLKVFIQDLIACLIVFTFLGYIIALLAKG